jgi:hypothetical protein
VLFAVTLERTVLQQGIIYVEAPNADAAWQGAYNELVTDVYGTLDHVEDWEDVDGAEAEVNVTEVEERPEEDGWILPAFEVMDLVEDR